MSQSTHRTVGTRRQAAFTLLEVVLAVAMLALVITAVYSTWNGALKAWKRGSEVAETFQRQRIVMDTLAELAKSMTFFSSQSGLYAVIAEHGRSGDDSVSFVTASDVSLPQSESLAAGMRRVTISLARSGHDRPYLSLVNEPALEIQDESTPATSHVLSTDVTGFYVRYRNPRDGSWSDEWTEENMVPSAMEFTVVFGGRPGRAPPVVVTRAVELPAAQYAMAALGQQLDQQSTTNEVKRRDDIDVGSLLRKHGEETE